MAMTLTTILGDDGPSLVLRIDIHQIKIIKKLFPFQCTAIYVTSLTSIQILLRAYGIYTTQ